MRPGPPSSRQKILDVAEELFAARGYAAVGVSAVAARAGLGKSSLFHHFPSKAALYCAVLGRVLGRIEVRLRPVFERAGSAGARLEAAVDALIDALAEHPPSARLALRQMFEQQDPTLAEPLDAAEIDRQLAGLIEGVGGILEAGVAAGEFRAVSIPEILQIIVGATVYHFASGEFGEGLLGGSLFSADAVSRRKRELKALLAQGLAPEPPRPTGGTP